MTRTFIRKEANDATKVNLEIWLWSGRGNPGLQICEQSKKAPKEHGHLELERMAKAFPKLC